MSSKPGSFHIVTQNISKSYTMQDQTLPILQDINLKVKAGSSVALVGSSGVGKSTLLSILAALDVPDGGNIEILGQDIMVMNEDQRAGLRCGKIAFVFQSFQLMKDFTALQNVLVPLQIAVKNKQLQLSKQQMQERAEDYLKQVGLCDRMHHMPAQLSGGEQQRVALARAFVIEPQLLFADEPTGNLDEQTGEAIINLLFTLQKEKQTTLVLVTHDFALAKQCDVIYQLAKGTMHEWHS